MTLSDTKSAHHSNLFALVEDIRAHGCTQREEADKHHDGDSCAKDVINYSFQLLVLLCRLVGLMNLKFWI